MKLLKKLLTVVLVVNLSLTSVAFGASFNDVPPEHWAYSAIEKVAELGIMSGNSMGNFGPNDLFDKFETTRILAAVAGYRAENPTDNERSYYESCYNKHYPFISQYSQKFTKWKPEMDMQIAYLLEIGVYTESDLNAFVVIVDGEERLRALSREEVCVFFARLLGEEELAKSFVPIENFKDDANINGAFKPYVYYMKHIGIVNGDSDGNFSPNTGVVKAAMATMLDKITTRIGYGTPNLNVDVPLPADNYSSVSGNIIQVYTSFRAVEIVNPLTNETKIYPVLGTANITVDMIKSTFENLVPGMKAAAILINGEVSELMAVSVVTNVPETPAETQSPPETTSNIVSGVFSTIEGTVKTTKTDVNGNYIDILVRLLNFRGEIIEETRSFILDASCTITRGGNPAEFTSIIPGDVVKANISGATVFSVALEEKYRTISGTLMGKKYLEATDSSVLTIQDNTGKIYEFAGTTTTVFTRQGSQGPLTWKDIRIGDKVEISLEYERIMSLAATGARSFLDAWITKISISQNYAEITAVDDKGVEKVYPIIGSSGIDPYTLRVGTKVSLGLDSLEVENVLVLQNVQTDFFTGFITSIGGNSLTIRDSSGLSAGHITFSFDANTILMDSIAGTRTNLASLLLNMKVYVVFDNSAPNYAKTITILSY